MALPLSNAELELLPYLSAQQLVEMEGLLRPWATTQKLSEWCKEFLPNNFFRPSSKLHAFLSDELSGMHLRRGLKENIVAPRDSAKSTWISLAYPIYCAVEELEPYILLVSETLDQSRRYLRQIRTQLESNAKLRAAYPHACGVGEEWTQSRIVLRNGVEIEGVGTGSAVRGRRRDQNRPTLVIVDDPQGRQHITSPTRRRNDKVWLQQDLLNVGSSDTNYFVVGTALHRDCIVMDLERNPGWRSHIFKALIKEPTNQKLWQEWRDIYTNCDDLERAKTARAFYEANRAAMIAGADVLWEANEDLYSLQRRRVDIGRTAFESEKQSNPVNPELCEWPEEYFDDRIWFDEWPECVYRVIALDPSKGKSDKRGDYSAFVMLGVDAAGTLFVDADIRRRPIAEIVGDAARLWLDFRPNGFACEVNQMQELLLDMIQDEFRAAGIVSPPLMGIDNRINKVVRIRSLSSWLSGGRIKLKARSPGCELLVQQLQDFPIGDHDDGPDALEMAVRVAMEVSQGMA